MSAGNWHWVSRGTSSWFLECCNTRLCGPDADGEDTASPSSFFLSFVVWWGKLWTIHKNLVLNSVINSCLRLESQLTNVDLIFYVCKVKQLNQRTVKTPWVSLLLSGMHRRAGFLLSVVNAPFPPQCSSSLPFAHPALLTKQEARHRCTDSRSSQEVNGSKHRLLDDWAALSSALIIFFLLGQLHS